MKQGLGYTDNAILHRDVPLAGSITDSRAMINVRGWDELGEEDFSSWRSLSRRAKGSPKWSPDACRAYIGTGRARAPLLIWLADKGDWRAAVVLDVYPGLGRIVAGRHLTTPFGAEIGGMAPVVESGFERPFAASFLAWLNGLPQRPLAVDLSPLSKRSVLTNAFLSEGTDAFDVSIISQVTVPYRQLDGPWTPWTQGSKNMREQLRRRGRQLNNGRWKVVCTDRADDADGFDRAFERLVEIEGAGWKRGIGAVAQNADSLRHYQLLFKDRCDIGARIYSLRVEETVAASNLVLYAHDRFLLTRQAYDEAYRAYSPGVLLMAAMVDAISRESPHGVIDFDGPATPFSRRFLDKEDERVRISLYSRTPAGRAYRRLRESITFMRTKGRGMRRKFRIVLRKLQDGRWRARSGRGGDR